MFYTLVQMACVSICWAALYDRMTEHELPFLRKSFLATVFSSFALIPIFGWLLVWLAIIDLFVKRK
jgi:hypothetical protein